ncbi:hypothetical protein TcWFU_000085 [Taenia crassiceps]|uniref:Uncharacterized protein n=1 Tax=Taenia crassiceps TaxID=6207 RepID=A0ABR4QF85_9CEST
MFGDCTFLVWSVQQTPLSWRRRRQIPTRQERALNTNSSQPVPIRVKTCHDLEKFVLPSAVCSGCNVQMMSYSAYSLILAAFTIVFALFLLWMGKTPLAVYYQHFPPGPVAVNTE